MKKIVWSNSSFEDSEFVVIGVPDEKGSLTTRKGASKAPDSIRKASYRSYFKHSHGSVYYEPEIGKEKKIHDYGNIKKQDIEKTVKKLLEKKKIPCFLGGDHSITYDILKAYGKKNISVVYFDAHPDATIADKPTYDAVTYYLQEDGIIDVTKSAFVGIRAADPQENENLEDWGIAVIRPHHIEELSVNKILDMIKKKIKPPIYLSIDLDCMDPAFAPGVSTPVPGGLSSRELFYMTRKIASLGLIGFDIVELVPQQDIQEMTSHLAANLVREITASCK